MRIEDYALIGDTYTAGLVGKDGSLDWLCLPRFDSSACFAALLGETKHGRWLMAPGVPVKETKRAYRTDTLVLETEFTTDHGRVRVTDCMPVRKKSPSVIRSVEGLAGRVPMRMELVIRFDYGSLVPWVRKVDGALLAIGGDDAVTLRSDVATHGQDMTTAADFTLERGDVARFVLAWHESHTPSPPPIDAGRAIEETATFWRRWCARSSARGSFREVALRSLITLKALTYAPTGGIVAAATTSLPERIGGVRNWDYRYCWVRDATFTLYALMLAGYQDEACAWRDWLLRAVAGDPSRLQILYGVSGERRLTEIELGWLPGYEGSKPVRIGNAAVEQFQLDVYGELMDAMHQARRVGIHPDAHAWKIERAIIDVLEECWQKPDEGIWEVRGPRRHFTHSKVMAWVALDRAVKAIERFGHTGPIEKWRQVRSAIHDEVCREGYDAAKRTFTQYYGSREVDASLLMIPLVGFLPPSDERVRGTLAAVEKDLYKDGFVLRYRSSGAADVDGLPPGEGAFLPCTFWLADNHALQGNMARAGKSSKASWRYATTWASCRKSTTRSKSACSATFRKPFLTSLSSIQHATSRTRRRAPPCTASRASALARRPCDPPLSSWVSVERRVSVRRAAIGDRGARKGPSPKKIG